MSANPLPPGSLSLFESLHAVRDQHYYLKQAARYGPVFKMAQYHQKVICVVGLERAQQLLRERDDALGPSPLPFTRQIAGGFLRYMDRSTYQQYGNLFRKALGKKVVDAAAPVTMQTARDEFTKMAVACLQTREHAVHPAPFLERITHDAFLRALFGIAPDCKAYTEFNSLYHGLHSWRIGRPLSSQVQHARHALTAFLRRHSFELNAHSQNGSETRCALTALTRLDANMPDVVCFDNLIFTLKISISNVVGLLRWLLVHLGENPDWMERLCMELNSDAATLFDLMDRIIMETLRLSQSEYLYRKVTRDFEYGGWSFPKGWFV